jgi:HNH endonuclease
MLKLDYREQIGAAEEHCEAIMNALSAPKRKKGRKDYFDKILRTVFGNNGGITLESIIKAPPSQLLELYQSIQANPAKFQKQFFKTSKKKKKPSLTKSGKEFYDLYSLLGQSSADRQNARHSLFSKIDLKTCPYCNRQPIASIESAGDLKQTGDLDHIIPRAKYPIFSVSFFNLVPACKQCNFLKKDADLSIVSPYDDHINMQEDVRFGIQLKNSEFPVQLSSFGVSLFASDSILQNTELENRVQNSLKVFRLRELYKMHKDIAHEAIQRHHVYSDDYQEELFQRYGGSVFADRAALRRMLFGRYSNPDDLHLRPLSKFTRDIEEYFEGRTALMHPLEPRSVDE